MSFEEITKSVWETIQNSIEYIANGFNAFLAFLAKIIPLYLLLGVVIAHVEQLISKKQSMSSVFISITGSFIVVYTMTPVINHYLLGSPFYGVATLAIGYFIQYFIKFVTNQKRVNAWLLRGEQFAIDWLKNKFKKK